MTLTTLSSKGQFTIPKPLRAHLGVVPGDKLLLGVKDGTLIVRALGNIVQATADSLKRYVPKDKLGRPWEEIIETTKKLAAAELATEGTGR
jgi:AbrB family looped-hinge helix DNA binding protein